MEEQAILAALERMAQMQDSIRSGMDICRDTGACVPAGLL